MRLILKVGSVHCWKRYSLTGAVPVLVLPHAVTAGALLYIEQEYLIAGTFLDISSNQLHISLNLDFLPVSEAEATQNHSTLNYS